MYKKNHIKIYQTISSFDFLKKINQIKKHIFSDEKWEIHEINLWLCLLILRKGFWIQCATLVNSYCIVNICHYNLHHNQYIRHRIHNFVEVFPVHAIASNQIKLYLYYTSTGYIYNATILHNHTQKVPINL